MPDSKATARQSWYCPLYKKDIQEGKCLEINYEQLGLLNAGNMKEVRALTHLTDEEICDTCLNCPNQPLKDERAK